MFVNCRTCHCHGPSQVYLSMYLDSQHLVITFHIACLGSPNELSSRPYFLYVSCPMVLGAHPGAFVNHLLTILMSCTLRRTLPGPLPSTLKPVEKSFRILNSVHKIVLVSGSTRIPHIVKLVSNFWLQGTQQEYRQPSPMVLPFFLPTL